MVKCIFTRKGTKKRYSLTNLVVNKQTISRHVGKLDPDIDNLSTKHQSGVYRGKFKHESFYFFQKGYKDPPYFPPPIDKQAWRRIRDEDICQVELYLQSLDNIDELKRNSKRQRLDNVYIIDKIQQITKTTEKIAKKDAVEVINTKKSWYWDSPEAKILFNPRDEESPLEC